MNVLFLDFDGPLFPTKSLSFIQNIPPPKEIEEINLQRSMGEEKMTYWKMETSSVYFLNHLASKKNFQVVISSFWSEIFSREEIEVLFKANDLRLRTRLHKDWRVDPSHIGRLNKIKAWLESHEGEIENFHIIDDEASGFTLHASEEFKSKQTIVSEENGFIKRDMTRILSIVGQW